MKSPGQVSVGPQEPQRIQTQGSGYLFGRPVPAAQAALLLQNLTVMKAVA
jgi:hypothetical protein